MSFRLFLTADAYRSHVRAAHAYQRIMQDQSRGLVCLVDDPDQAQVSYIHKEPHTVPKLLDAVPALRKTYRIGYFVWEADSLPAPHIAGVRLMDEVWTASLYNWRTLSRVHPNVHWIPHCTNDAVQAPPAETERMRHLLDIKPQDFCVFHITLATLVRRKNTAALLRAFAYMHDRHPNARLIIKSGAGSNGLRVLREGPVSWLFGHLSDAQMAALHGLVHTYASPHHGEGWGLTLPDAMQHGVLTIATDYSGNKDFMTPANSLLVRYTEANIAKKDLSADYTASMRWAYPHRENLEAQLLCAYAQVQSGAHLRRTAQAKRDMRHFDARHVAVLIRARLRAIAHTLAA